MKRLFLVLLLACIANAQNNEFPPDFKFGVATSAYQIEGAWNVNGKGESIWDWITHTNPEYIADSSNGDDACLAYYKTSEDVQLLKDLGVSFYRFSMSWSRLFPTGHVHQINQDGVDYYNRLIDELLDNDINPIVTMFHWDLPLALHELGGWPNPRLADYYVEYANKLFELFGEKVKYWITFNEPFQFCQQGYGSGKLAPAYRQSGHGGYLCGHTVLLAHARTFRLYNKKYRLTQYGQIGITLDSEWFEPEDNESDAHIEAAETSIQMMLGWFANPIYSNAGDYPEIMKKRIEALSDAESFRKSRLPKFTPEEVDCIRGTADFFGLNHYTSSVCTPAPDQDALPTASYEKDVGSYCYKPNDWQGAASSWLKVAPWGLKKLLNWIRTNYGNPPVLITENGFSDFSGTINDCNRVNYFNAYLEQVLSAIHEDRCQVVAYTAWSLMDNFEWTQGYREKFGLHRVDFNDPERVRVPKLSATVYKNLIETRTIDWDYLPPEEVCTDEYVFPVDFKFGVATAAYQVEGAWNIADKGESIWDRLTNSNPGTIADGSNGNIACDSYHKTEEDVQLLKQLGVNFYRFSISWSRLFPQGYVNYTSDDGLRYYNELIGALVANDITPMVTLYHWDLPQNLQDIGGWPNSLLADIFMDYADAVFNHFGEHVKEWITFNEPYQICADGYSEGAKAPLYTQDGVGGYMCGYTILLAHAKAYRLYQDRYKEIQNGRVGITVHGMWAEAASNSASDQEIAERHIQMHFGWFLHPIFLGDYPAVMKERIDALSIAQNFPRSRLQALTPEEITLIRGTADFLGLNHYTSTVCSANGGSTDLAPSHLADRGGNCYAPDDWEQAASSWLNVTPWGFRNLLIWIRNQYDNPEVIITENGYSDVGGLNDCDRINYYNSYLEALLEAMYEDDCHVTAYTYWSFLDNFEWMRGYTERFGLYSVNFASIQRSRTPKMSSHVFANIISSRKINWEYTPEGFAACEFDR